jgi:hypothetical protein
MEIFRTESYHFLYLIRSNPHFLSDFTVFAFAFRMFCISNVKVENSFDIFRPFSTFNWKYFEFKIRFKPNLTNCTGHTAQLQAAHHATAFFLLVASCPLL